MHLPTHVMTTNKLLTIIVEINIYENDTIRGYMTITLNYMRWLVFYIYIIIEGVRIFFINFYTLKHNYSLLYL
jgi:hypothetical protein